MKKREREIYAGRIVKRKKSKFKEKVYHLGFVGLVPALCGYGMYNYYLLFTWPHQAAIIFGLITAAIIASMLGTMLRELQK